jgi:hypothetical protein
MTPYQKCKQDAARVCREIKDKHYRFSNEANDDATRFSADHHGAGAAECEQAILALPEPRGWTDEEIMEVWRRMRPAYAVLLNGDALAFARALLGGGK